jgi:hypothetical protein
MARAVSAADGSRAVHIRPAISEAFVVRHAARVSLSSGLLLTSRAMHIRPASLEEYMVPRPETVFPVFLCCWCSHIRSDNKAAMHNAPPMPSRIGT